jgi:VIT1/CCC1 family predicted Fe2+/Mn2+ transporter
MLPVSYAIYVLFLTPTFVIASRSSVGHWRLAAVRAIYTTIGTMYGFVPHHE